MECYEVFLAGDSADHAGSGLGTGVATGLSSGPAVLLGGLLTPTSILLPLFFLPKCYSFRPHQTFCPLCLPLCRLPPFVTLLLALLPALAASVPLFPTPTLPSAHSSRHPASMLCCRIPANSRPICPCLSVHLYCPHSPSCSPWPPELVPPGWPFPGWLGTAVPVCFQPRCLLCLQWPRSSFQWGPGAGSDI